MSEFSQVLLDYKTSFLQGNPSSLPEVVCVFIGGSRLYKPQKPGSPQNDQPSDYDGIVVVKKKCDMYSLTSDRLHRQCLLNLIGIERENEVDLHVPSPNSALFSECDCVRVSGYDKDNVKRSVSVLSLEYFSSGRTSLNRLSHKDRRVYTIHPLGNGPSITTLDQATTLDTGVILHTQWVYTARTEDRKVLGVFGAFSDLLITGASVYGEYHGLEIKRLLLDHYASKTGYYPRISTFAKHPAFSTVFTEWFSKELAELCPKSSDVDFVPSLKGQAHIFMFGDTTKTQVDVSINKPSYVRKISEEAVTQFNEGRVIRQGFKPQFSRNSEAYIVTTTPPGDTHEMFVKKSPHTQDELEGSKMAARYFHRVLEPRMAHSGELLFPLFRGKVESEARLAHILGGRQDIALAESILYVELVRAEYTLRVHRSSLCLKPSVPAPRQNIQRFFHDRLVDDRRMREFYGRGVELAGERYSLDKLLSFRWVINGRHYAPLRQAFDEAKGMLAPNSVQMLSCPTVFGGGDSHGGNVMLCPSGAKGGTSEVLFIDNETAGVHPIMLDLAKPLFVDVFFESLYYHRLPENIDGALKCHVDQDTNTVVVDFKPKRDPLSQAILDIKLQYLIKPLSDQVEDLEQHVPLLTAALFACCTVAANCSENEQAFLRIFSTGLVLREAKNWVELVLQLEVLGFK
ncbi:hypothetical protein F4825DRAFT_474195 [Nemania diffusa]|nr:hypothetical protein F4825DRAFT_474195 [Nemania diffusa]